ncbi:MAG: Ti-type conjugative transfer relaxase TraA [Methylococcaceae bacterium]|nr:Ti-type conjugative transfer relaxase TraA [Methylococcaceae bacterium]
MAIEYASTSILSRSKGHSAIKASAYRSGDKMYDDRIGLTVNYAHRKHEVIFSEIMIPEGVDIAYTDRETLWNAVEDSEHRKDSQLAKDHVIALPKELSQKQYIEMAKQFAQEQFVKEGVAVDINIHYHSADNPHAHLMTTTRVIDENGFGKKATHLNPSFSGRGRVSAEEQIRHQWADYQNKYFQENNIGLEVTNNNGEFATQVHMGAANQLEKDGIKTDKGDHNRQVQLQKTKELLDNPDKIIELVSDRKSVFSKHDLYRELFKHINDKHIFEEIKSKLDCSEKLLSLTKSSKKTQFYTTKDVLETEQSIREIAEVLGTSVSNHGVNSPSIERVKSNYSFLSNEQKEAINEVTNSKRLSIVVGFAGAGKSTMFKAAKEIWEDSGFKVKGIALAGKAAEGLEKSSDIKSSTIHRLLYDIKNGSYPLDNKTVLVMDEAGMVNNKLMKSILDEVEKTGAKLVLAGDSEQLQPIQAGNPFRDMSEINGFTEISTIRRQQEDWQREATYNLSQGCSVSAINAYAENGSIKLAETHQDAINDIVRDYLKETHTRKNMAVLAHKRVDVEELNQNIRKTLLIRGEVHTEITTQTTEGKKQFGTGDRILFLKNNKQLGVTNGSLGTVEETHEKNAQLLIKLDNGKSIKVDTNKYQNITYGYAMTIHKSQGVTVDHAMVLATQSFDKHLAYVSLSRHKESVKVYAGKDELENHDAMAKQFSRLKRQESISTFAKRHGIDFQESSLKQNIKKEKGAEYPEENHFQKLMKKIEKNLKEEKSINEQQYNKIRDEMKRCIEQLQKSGVQINNKLLFILQKQIIKRERGHQHSIGIER